MKRAKGGKGSEAYCITGFRVPTTSVGARGEGAMGSKGGGRSKGEQRHVILGFRVPTTSVGARGERARRIEGGGKGE